MEVLHIRGGELADALPPQRKSKPGVADAAPAEVVAARKLPELLVQPHAGRRPGAQAWLPQQLTLSNVTYVRPPSDQE